MQTIRAGLDLNLGQCLWAGLPFVEVYYHWKNMDIKEVNLGREPDTNKTLI